MKFITKRRVIVFAVVVLGGLLVWSLTRETPVAVETAVAERAALTVTVDEDGRTRAIDRFVVTSPVAGRVRRIDLRAGATVEANAIVARIEPLPLDAATRMRLEAERTAAQSRVGAAQATHERARSARDQAQRELERRRALVAEGAIPAEQLEQYQLALDAREEELRNAEAAARAAASDVEALSAALLGAEGGGIVPVRAPVAGRVLDVPEHSERVVQAGEPLVQIGDVDALEGVIDVLTTDAVRVQPGMSVRVTGWGGPDFDARVRHVEPSAFTRLSALGVEEQRVNVILDLQDCPPQLGDGYRIEASIQVWHGEDVLTVPSSALFRVQDGWRVFVHEAGRARLRTVTPGERSGVSTQIVDGLEEGERVVLFPSDQLNDGAAVEAARGS
jgi:HlyD family secretion protein